MPSTVAPAAPSAFRRRDLRMVPPAANVETLRLSDDHLARATEPGGVSDDAHHVRAERYSARGRGNTYVSTGEYSGVARQPLLNRGPYQRAGEGAQIERGNRRNLRRQPPLQHRYDEEGVVANKRTAA